LDLKQSGVLHFPSTERFIDLVMHGENNDQPVKYLAEYEQARQEFRQNLDKAINTKMLSMVSLESSKTLLNRILNKAADNSTFTYRVDSLDKAADSKLQLELGEERGSVRLDKKLTRWELKAQFLEKFRAALFDQYFVDLGSGIASQLKSCDERIPYARNYPVYATCN
jgi:hypothetical protein